MHGDGHWGPAAGGGGGASDEILIVADTSTADQTVTLPDPATLPALTTVVNVKNWKGGIFELHIAPGVGGTIDLRTDGIRTRTDNQGYRFRWGPSADTGPVDGWVCIETVFGGGDANAEVGGQPPTPGVQACADDIPFWITEPSAAQDYQVFTADGTWTKPSISDATFVAVVGWGAGGGGGSGSYGDDVVRGGGGGGGGGARKIQVWKIEDVPDTVAVTVGAGGSGGSPITGGHAAGNAGSVGGASTFGALFSVGGGGGGGGGTSVTAYGGGGGGWDSDGTTAVLDTPGRGGDNPVPTFNANGVEGQGGNGTGNEKSDEYSTWPDGCAECGGGGGGGGGSGLPGYPTGAGTYGGGNGGSSINGGGGGGAGGYAYFGGGGLWDQGGNGGACGGTTNGGGGAGGVSYGQSGTAGADALTGTLLSGNGGGGGSGKLGGESVTAGSGANGGIPGGGGGGGGGLYSGAPTSCSSGAGGDGARGEIRVYVR